MLPAMLLHIAVRLLCRDNYLTAKTDRFLVVSKESMMTPQAGLGGIRTGTAEARFKQTVTDFVLFDLPELHSRAIF